ncbi:MAG: hypothetical protein C4334_10400 [Pyrinomonas sp.]
MKNERCPRWKINERALCALRGHRITWAILLALSTSFSTLAQTARLRGTDVSEARFRRLQHGINTSHWFAQILGGRPYTREHLESHTTEADIRLIEAMGFDHVRLSVEPAPLWNQTDPAKLNAEYLSYLDRAIEKILAHDLAVIIDIHPTDEFKLKLRDDDRHAEAFARFWRALAAHLSRTDPERVFLEAINEPMVEDGYRWMGIQAKLVAAMREGAPRHTIIACGHRWSGLGELLFLEPLADRNVIYNLHFYEPMAFTHQGATWAGPNLPSLRNVPYPVTPEAIAPLLATLNDEEAREVLRAYGNARWNGARIEAEIAKAAQWAARHGVRVICNEFGVYRRFSPPEARAAWLRDVRTALEKHGIGWTMWDYQGGFSVVQKVNGRIVPDEQTLEALGLQRLSSSRR